MRPKLMFLLMLLGVCWFLLAAVTVLPPIVWDAGVDAPDVYKTLLEISIPL